MPSQPFSDVRRLVAALTLAGALALSVSTLTQPADLPPSAGSSTQTPPPALREWIWD